MIDRICSMCAGMFDEDFLSQGTWADFVEGELYGDEECADLCRDFYECHMGEVFNNSGYGNPTGLYWECDCCRMVQSGNVYTNEED